jgi:hypothetical protein
MTEASAPVPPVAPLAERIIFALRQAALLGVALLVAGLVTERLRPDQVLDRGIASTPFLWAIVLWLAALLFNAIAFERPQTRALEGLPLFAASGAGAVVFLAGLITLDGGSFGRRFIYLFATGLGAIMFWWAVLSLGFLVTQRLRA